jgi:hypothetical protein
MTLSLPRQGESYRGPITDTRRWTNFQHRPDDIFVCTPPKCGTTWTQAICASLVFGTAAHGVRPGSISLWLDAAVAPIEERLQQAEAQSHRRFFKTHTPFDGIPYFPACTYLVIFRDPRDVYFSVLNHLGNMSDEKLALMLSPGGPVAFPDWLRREREPGTWDVPVLQSLTHFFKTYWPYRVLDNVHLFHYSNMVRDLKGTISSMAAALDVEIDDAQLAEFTEAASFDSMKRNAEHFVPFSGTDFWKADTNFFASGSNRQWQGKLSVDELAAFDARIAELLPPEEVDWLLNGYG